MVRLCDGVGLSGRGNNGSGGDGGRVSVGGNDGGDSRGGNGAGLGCMVAKHGGRVGMESKGDSGDCAKEEDGRWWLILRGSLRRRGIHIIIVEV